MKFFSKPIRNCMECPNFRTNRFDPNPDVGFSFTPERCAAANKPLLHSVYWDEGNYSRRCGWVFHGFPDWCPLQEVNDGA